MDESKQTNLDFPALTILMESENEPNSSEQGQVTKTYHPERITKLSSYKWLTFLGNSNEVKYSPLNLESSKNDTANNTTRVCGTSDCTIL